MIVNFIVPMRESLFYMSNSMGVFSIKVVGMLIESQTWESENYSLPFNQKCALTWCSTRLCSEMTFIFHFALSITSRDTIFNGNKSSRISRFLAENAKFDSFLMLKKGRAVKICSSEIFQDQECANDNFEQYRKLGFLYNVTIIDHRPWADILGSSCKISHNIRKKYRKHFPVELFSRKVIFL